MDMSNYFRIANLAVGVLMVLGGITQFFPMSLRSVVVGCYVILFGVTTGGLELVPNVPPYVQRYASFLFSFLGRGVFYIFVGSILLSDNTLRIIAGTLVGIVGVAFCALEYIPSIEPPANMRDGEAGWGAEQV